LAPTDANRNYATNWLPISLVALAAAIVFAGAMISERISAASRAQIVAQQQTTSAINSAALQAQSDASIANNHALLARSQQEHDALMQQLATQRAHQHALI
jgi:hypothetical protein